MSLYYFCNRRKKKALSCPGAELRWGAGWTHRSQSLSEIPRGPPTGSPVWSSPPMPPQGAGGRGSSGSWPARTLPMAGPTWWKLKQILTQLKAGLSDRAAGEGERGVGCEQGSELTVSRDARSFTLRLVREQRRCEGDTSPGDQRG